MNPYANNIYFNPDGTTRNNLTEREEDLAYHARLFIRAEAAREAREAAEREARNRPLTTSDMVIPTVERYFPDEATKQAYYRPLYADIHRQPQQPSHHAQVPHQSPYFEAPQQVDADAFQGKHITMPDGTTYSEGTWVRRYK